MPVRQARSHTRGRPPCGFGSEAGRSGSIKPHNISGTSASAMRSPPQEDVVELLYKEGFCYRLLVLTVTSSSRRQGTKAGLYKIYKLG